MFSSKCNYYCFALYLRRIIILLYYSYLEGIVPRQKATVPDDEEPKVEFKRNTANSSKKIEFPEYVNQEAIIDRAPITLNAIYETPADISNAINGWLLVNHPMLRNDNLTPKKKVIPKREKKAAPKREKKATPKIGKKVAPKIGKKATPRSVKIEKIVSPSDFSDNHGLVPRGMPALRQNCYINASIQLLAACSEYVGVDPVS